MCVDGADGAPEVIARSRLDLDKDDLAPFLDNQVELAAGAPPVPVAEPVALEQEEEQRRPLPSTSESLTIHRVLVTIVP